MTNPASALAALALIAMSAACETVDLSKSSCGIA